MKWGLPSPRVWRMLLASALGLVLTSVFPVPIVHAQQAPEPSSIQARRTVLSDVPGDVLPRLSNIWTCDCDTDGCWPGCFTVASANVLKYWASRGYPLLWNGDENGTLQRLRELFPNLYCYNNRDDDGQPSDSAYDAFDVVRGITLFARERGYDFNAQAIPNPTFEQIAAEIDAGRPVIGAFGVSPWGSHAGTIIGYDATGGRQIIIVRPNLLNRPDTELVWGRGYRDLSIVTFAPAQGSPSELPRQSFEIVVDDSDPNVRFAGEWLTVEEGFVGAARYTLSADEVNTARQQETAFIRWTPSVPFDGLWEVFAWIPREDARESTALVATYQIAHAEGMRLIRRSQQQAKQGWMSLGAHPFLQGSRGYIQLTNLTGDVPPRVLWADAIKLVWRAPLLVRDEAGGPVMLVLNGKRRAIPDPQTAEALRLNPADVRTLPSLMLAQYPLGEPIPSVMSRWVGAFYNNVLFAPPFADITGLRELAFIVGETLPPVQVGSRDFSVRWTRYLALSDGDYAFRVEAVGGVRLWINGRLEISAWDSPDDILVAHEKNVPLQAGLHRVDVEYIVRSSAARLRLANLPPNAPVLEPLPVAWTSAPTVTLRWRDTGDADDVEGQKPRTFFATLRHEEGWRTTSGWMTATEWTTVLPVEGTYRWHVIASDGTANSPPSEVQTFNVDRRPPWAQMQAAITTFTHTVELMLPAPGAYRAITNADGTVRIDAIAGQPDVQLPAPGSITPGGALGNLPAVYLRWWGNDVPNDPPQLRYDVQARQLVRAHTSYTVTTVTQEVTRIGYELVLSGSQEITVPVVLTESIEQLAVVPIVTFVTLSQTEWVTIATGLTTTGMVFIGEPGGTYEFRVRATDAAGNQQRWFDGYAVRAEIDPRRIAYRSYLPTIYYAGQPSGQ